MVHETRTDFPKFLKVSSADALLLKNSYLLKHSQPLIYACNTYESNSREMIEMLITEGNSISPYH